MVTQLGTSEHGLELICTVEKCVLITAGPGTRDVRIKKTNMFLA